MLVDRLADFACAHDRRGNVAAHAIGVPLLSLAVGTLLGLVRVHVAGLVPTLADAAWVALAIVWVRLDARLGLATALAALPVLLLANHLAAAGVVDGLLAVVTLAVLGVGFEIGGHAIEGTRPVVLTDRRAVYVAPLFLVATAAFAIGWREALADEVDGRVRATLPPPAPARAETPRTPGAIRVRAVADPRTPR